MLPTPNALGPLNSDGSISEEVTFSQTPGVPGAGGSTTMPPLPPFGLPAWPLLLPPCPAPAVDSAPAVPAAAPPVAAGLSLPQALLSTNQIDKLSASST